MIRIFKGEVLRLFPILEAIKEGKTIQFHVLDGWRDIDGDDEGFCLETLIGESDKYRIKPEPKYRPFANAEECWQEMKKHQPFGWVKSRCDETLIQSILSISKEGITLVLDSDNFCVMFDTYTFADGSVFGVKEESEG